MKKYKVVFVIRSSVDGELLLDNIPEGGLQEALDSVVASSGISSQKAGGMAKFNVSSRTVIIEENISE